MTQTDVSSYEKNHFRFIRLSVDQDYVDLCPQRGGMAVAFRTAGTDVLYMNPSTLYDRSKNVRGGIPVLFPMAGQLPNKTYTLNGRMYRMENHGLARQRPWTVVETKADATHAEATLVFRSNMDTKKSFPFDFEAAYTYRFSGNTLTVRLAVRNFSAAAMPIYPGFHPYFNIKDKKMSIKTKAAKYTDDNDGKIKSLASQIDLTDRKEAVLFADDSSRIAVRFDAGHQLVLEKSQAFRYIVLWSEPGKNFVCVEPWTAKKNEYNVGKELIKVEKGQPFKASIAISLIAG